MIRPDAVIGGTPKSGTTSLFRWLAEHPQICGSQPKETRFLLDRDSPMFDRNSSVHIQGLEGYARFFNRCSRSKLLVEATPDYLYQETALEVLSRLDPQPHMIFILRKPADRVYSFYQYARSSMAILAPRISFRQFVDLLLREPDSAALQRGTLRNTLYYSQYRPHLDRWRARFAPEKFHVLLLEEMRNRPGVVLKRLAISLGVDPGFYSTFDFPRENESIGFRSTWMQRLRRRLGRLSPDGPWKEYGRRIYLAFNSKPTSTPTSEDSEVIGELESWFEAENAELFRTYAIDPSWWTREFTEDKNPSPH